MEEILNCRLYHDSCIKANLDKILVALKYTLKVYTIAHSTPAFLFKRKQLFNNPLKFITDLIKNIVKSMGFLSTFIVLVRTIHCLSFHYRNKKFDAITIAVMSILCTLCVNLESVHRIEEYTIFTLPRAFEGLWDLLEKLGYVRNIKNSMLIMFSVSVGILMVIRKHYGDFMPITYKNQLDYIFRNKYVK